MRMEVWKNWMQMPSADVVCEQITRSERYLSEVGQNR